VGFGGEVLDGLHGGGAGAEGVFVGGKFENVVWVEAEFAGGFFDRFSGLVGVEVADELIGGVHRSLKW